MSHHLADRKGGPNASESFLERFRAAGIGAFFRPSQLEAAGLTRSQLPALMRSGTVERIDRGLYRLAAAEVTENYTRAAVCARIPKAILCLLTALTYHGIGTQIPQAVWIAIPHKARAPRFQGVRLEVIRFSKIYLTHGVISVQLEGVRARVTDPARTVVDCFRFRRLVGHDVALEALEDAIRSRKATPAEIWRVANVCRVRTVVEPYLELLSMRHV